MFFDEAFKLVRQGERVRRRGWGGPRDAGSWTRMALPASGGLVTEPYLIIGWSGGVVVYDPSAQDLFADDWEVVE